MHRLAAVAVLVLLNAAAVDPAAGQEESPGTLSISAVRNALRPGAQFLVRAYGKPPDVLLRESADGALEAELSEYFASLSVGTSRERFADPTGGLNRIAADRLEDASLAAFGAPSCSFIIANRGFATAAESTATSLSAAAHRWALANTRVVERNMRRLVDGMHRIAQADPGMAGAAVRTALGRQRGMLYGLREQTDRFLDKYARISTEFANTLYGDPARSAASIGSKISPILVSALERAMPPAGSDEERARRLSAAIDRIESSGIQLDQTISTGCNTPAPGVLLGSGNVAGGGAPGLYQQLVRSAYLYQAIWGNELSRNLGVERGDLRPALGEVERQSQGIADRIVDFRNGFLPLVEVARGRPLLEIAEISWDDGEEDDYEVVISGPSEIAWDATADYQLLLLKDGQAIRWYPIVRWKVAADTRAVLDEALARKKGIAASLTTAAPDSPLDETEITLTANYEDNLGPPGQVSKVISISNVKAECEKLRTDFDRLQSEIERKSRELAVQKKDLEQRLARTESDLARAEQELARPASGNLAARIAEQEKVIKASEDTLKNLKTARIKLASVRGRLFAILPEGARLHLANELFEEDPDDRARQMAFVKTVQPKHSGEVTSGDVEIAKKIVTDNLGARFGIGLQGIGSLITMMLPGSGQYSSVLTLVQLGIGVIADEIIDPTSFLDRQALKDVSGTSSQIKAAIARMTEVGAEVDKAARQLDELLDAGASRDDIEDVEARLVRLIKDLIREIDRVQPLVKTQIANLERLLEDKKAGLEAPESEQRDRADRRRDVTGAVQFLTEERDALKAKLETLETTRQSEIETLKAQLDKARQTLDENCRER